MPKVFISYAQKSIESKNHKNWVLNLANELIRDGIEVILDVYDLRVGNDLYLFMQESIKNSDKVILILTPEYKNKSENREGGVGYEYSIINQQLYDSLKNNIKFIPLIRVGSTQLSIPLFLQSLLWVDFRDDEYYIESYRKLIQELYDEPEFVKPKIGTKPKFLKNTKIFRYRLDDSQNMDDWGIYNQMKKFENVNFTFFEENQSWGFKLKADSIEEVGVNLFYLPKCGIINFKYKISNMNSLKSNILFFVIPVISEIGKNVIELGTEKPVESSNGFSPFRYRFFYKPIVNEWISVRIIYDFSDFEDVKYSIFAPRLNEGCPKPNMGEFCVSNIEVVGLPEISEILGNSNHITENPSDNTFTSFFDYFNYVKFRQNFGIIHSTQQ